MDIVQKTTMTYTPSPSTHGPLAHNIISPPFGQHGFLLSNATDFLQNKKTNNKTLPASLTSTVWPLLHQQPKAAELIPICIFMLVSRFTLFQIHCS